MAQRHPYTQLSLKHLRADDRFSLVEMVEYWTPFPKPHGRRVDLFGIGDILCLGPGITMLVQTSSAGGFSARKTKLTVEMVDVTRKVLEAGWLVEIHGWKKIRNRWELHKQLKIQLEE